MSPEEMQFRIVARATDLLYTESAFAERTCTVHQKDLSGRIGGRRARAAADALGGALGGARRAARMGDPAEHDGDGDGKRDADGDGQDDDPMPGGVAGVVARGARAVARGAAAIQEARNGGSDEDEGLVERGLRAAADFIRPGRRDRRNVSVEGFEGGRARAATEDVARSVPKTPERERVAASRRPKVNTAAKNARQALDEFDEKFGSGNRRFTFDNSFAGLLDAVGAEDFVDELWRRVDQLEDLTPHQREQLAEMKAEFEKLYTLGRTQSDGDVADMIHNHLDAHPLKRKLDALDKALGKAKERDRKSPAARAIADFDNNVNEQRFSMTDDDGMVFSGAGFVTLVKGRLQRGLEPTDRQLEQVEELRSAVDRLRNRAALDGDTDYQDEVEAHLLNHPLVERLQELDRVEQEDYDSMVAMRGMLRSWFDKVDQADVDELPSLENAARTALMQAERRDSPGSNREARVYQEILDQIATRQNQLADKPTGKVRARRKERAAREVEDALIPLDDARFRDSEGREVSSVEFIEGVAARMKDGQWPTDEEMDRIDMIKGRMSDLVRARNRHLDNLPSGVNKRVNKTIGDHERAVDKFEEAKSEAQQGAQEAVDLYKDLSRAIEDADTLQKLTQLLNKVNDEILANEDNPFRLRHLEQLASKIRELRRDDNFEQNRKDRRQRQVEAIRQRVASRVAGVRSSVEDLDNKRDADGHFSKWALMRLRESSESTARELVEARSQALNDLPESEDRDQLVKEFDEQLGEMLAIAHRAKLEWLDQNPDRHDNYDEWPDDLEPLDAEKLTKIAEELIGRVKAKKAADEPIDDELYDELEAFKHVKDFVESLNSRLNEDDDRRPRTLQRNSVEKLRDQDEELKRALRRPAPPDPPDPEKMRTKARELVRDVLARRKGILERYVKEQRDGVVPWKDSPSRDELAGATAEEVKDWQASVFVHDLILTKDGRKMRTRVTGNGDVYNRRGQVAGYIEMFDEERQEWRPVGHFARTLDYDSGLVYNSHMYIGNDATGYLSSAVDDLTQEDIEFANSAKNSGFQSIFNPQAFQFYKAAGFRRVKVSAAADGQYVWGRVGFRPNDEEYYIDVADAMHREVDKFRRGDRSIIRTEEQASMIMALVEESRALPRNEMVEKAPGIMEFSTILDQGGVDKGGDKRIRDFFVNNAEFSSGWFHLDRMESVE